MEVPKDKFILDPCCGGRLFWFDKKHPNTVYTDIRKEGKGVRPGRPKFEINPDYVMDFRQLEFPDESFKLVVFDPPHMVSGPPNIIIQYGELRAETWQSDLKRGFNECWRVLEPYGVLIFKWNNADIPYKRILKIIGKEPLFHQKMTKREKAKSQTYWACFMKIPKGDGE